MKSLRLVAVTVVMFLALGMASVYANPDGNLGLPILGTTGAPALAAPSLFSGAISVLYADGTPVVLQTNQVALNLCNTTCVPVTATLTQTAPGTYTYSFTPPTSMTGTVTIYIKANGLADDNGRVFPSVDTSIGTYAFSPSTTSSASQQPATSAPPAGSPVAPLTRQAVNTTPSQPTTTSPVEALLLTLSALTVAGTLLVIPKRH
jgi:hypothetical protein